MPKANFRLFNDNYGCAACLDNDRHKFSISSSSLFYRVVNKTHCENCYIYKMWKELQEYKEDYEDDRK